MLNRIVVDIMDIDKLEVFPSLLEDALCLNLEINDPVDKLAYYFLIQRTKITIIINEIFRVFFSNLSIIQYVSFDD